jgi:hypothetical protein
MIDPELFREIPIFSTLSEEELQTVAQVAHLKDYPSGSTLAEFGVASPFLFFILSGKVREIIRKVPGQPPTIRTLQEGAMLGGCCLVEKTSPLQEIVALNDIKVIEIAKHDFLTVIRDHPELLLAITEESALIQPVGEERHPPDVDRVEGDISHFEKLLDSELESIKLRYEVLEKQATDTMEMVEKHFQESVGQSEKEIGKLLLESKSELQKNQELVDKTISKLEGSTSASLEKVKIFWKWVVWIVPILGITGSLTVGTFIHYLSEVRRASEEAKTYAEKSKNDATEINQKRKQLEEDEKGVTKLTEEIQNNYKALESSASAIHSEVDVISPWRSLRLPDNIKEKYKDDTLRSIRYLTLNMYVNRIKLLSYLREYNKKDIIKQPESLVDAINAFLRLSLESKEKIKNNNQYYGDERALVWNCCLMSLDEFDVKYNKKDLPPDWRFNAKVQDNIVIFGNLMKDYDRTYYENYIIPDLEKYVTNTDLQIYAREAVAAALAMLWVQNKEAQQVLLQMYNKGRSPWAKSQAAACLLRLGDPEAYAFLDKMMGSKYGMEGFIAALSAGEVLLEEEANNRVNLKKLNPKTVIEVLKYKLTKEIDEGDINIFRRLYAEEIQRELQKKYGLQTPS